MRVESGYVLLAGEGRKPKINCIIIAPVKHAGMAGLAKLLGVPSQGYIGIESSCPSKNFRYHGSDCEYDLQQPRLGSPDWLLPAPTWADAHLTNLALAFCQVCESPEGYQRERQQACKNLIDAVVKHLLWWGNRAVIAPDMWGCCRQRVFLKVGAEGVYIAAIPELKTPPLR